MLHPAVYQKIGFFYALGNTPANNLAEYLPPEVDVRALLLGCGDPRHILFTSYLTEEAGKASGRKFDYTCCDVEGAVIARDVLLLSLIVGQKSSGVTDDEIFDAFYHPLVSERVVHVIEQQTEDLLRQFSSLESYQSSEYGKIIRVCNKDTLSELRSVWSLWLGLDVADKKAFKRGLLEKRERDRKFRESKSAGASVMTGGRSAGPLCGASIPVVMKQFEHFWKHGTTYTASSKELAQAKHVNPTFAFSSLGDGFGLHYGTDPILGFHLSTAFAPIQKDSPYGSVLTEKDGAAKVMQTCRQQFQKWCEAFRSLVSKEAITVRFYSGDALAFCHVLQARGSNVTIHAPPKPLTFKPCVLDGDAPPANFNVIDGSNLVDHTGFYNLFLSVAPLLEKMPYSVFYMETLLDYDHHKENGDAAFATFLGCDPRLLFTILGFAPAPYLCGYSSSGQTGDIIVKHLGKAAGTNEGVTQSFNRIPWKYLEYFETPNGLVRSNELDFDKQELVTVIYKIYQTIFSHENTLGMYSRLSLSKIMMAMNPHYTRISFVYLLGVIRSRLSRSFDWNGFMGSLLDAIGNDSSIMLRSNTLQELLTLAKMADVYEIDALKYPPQECLLKFGGKLMTGVSPRAKVPRLTCVTLVVPRKALKPLTSGNPETIGTPSFQLNTFTPEGHNLYGSVRYAFGRVKPDGEVNMVSPDIQYQAITVEEDRKAWDGTADLVVSALIPSWSLLSVNLANSDVFLNLTTTPSTVQLTKTFGLNLKIFGAKLNSKGVYFSEYFPGCETNLDIYIPSNPSEADSDSVRRKTAISVPQAQPSKLVRRLPFSSTAEHETLKNKTIAISHSKSGTRTAEVKVGTIVKTADFPYAVRDNLKLRIARTSGYVEVVAELSHPADFNKTVLFPVVQENKIPIPWAFHRVDLDRLPIIDIGKPGAELEWINTSITFGWSEGERKIRDANTGNTTTGHPLLDVKESLHSIFLRSVGLQSPRKFSVFSLHDDESGGGHTLIFVSCMRIDVGAHQNVVADAAVLPLEKGDMPALMELIRPLHMAQDICTVKTNGEETKAWKYLLPSLVERCRVGWTHKESCEYKRPGAQIPLSLPDHPEGVTPICSCGKGKPGKSFAWKGFAKYCTRIALCGLYSVPYATEVQDIGKRVEDIQRRAGGNKGTCAGCGKKESGGLQGAAGPTKISMCGGCKAVGYCSKECQAKDWKEHKKVCKLLAGGIAK